MASFNDIIKSGKCEAAYLKRQAILEEIKHNALSIKELDQEKPNDRIFSKLESNSNTSLEQLKKASIELNTLLIKACPDFRNDENYIADQKDVRKLEFSIMNEIENYITLLNNKGIKYPPEVKPEPLPANLSDILNNVLAAQNKNVSDLGLPSR